MRQDTAGRQYVVTDSDAPLQIDSSTPIGTRSASFQPWGYQQITSLSSAAGLTVPEGAKYALIQAESKDVRWRDDGTAPTGSVGMVLTAGGGMWYDGDLSALLFIQTAASAKLNVLYYG